MRLVRLSLLGILLSMCCLPSSAADAPSELAAFVAAMPDGSWAQIPNSSIKTVLATRAEAPDQGGVDGSTSVIYGYSGAAFDGRRWYFHGGGRGDYSGNEVYAFDFDTLKWQRVTQPSPFKPGSQSQRCPDTADGTPASSQSLDGFLYVPTTRSIWLWGGDQYCRSGGRGRDAVWEFNPASRKWTSHPRDPLGGAVLSAFDAGTGRVVLFSAPVAEWFDPRTGRYFGPSPNTGDAGMGTGVIDPKDRNFWALVRGGLIRSHMGDDRMGPIEYVTKPEDLPGGLNYGSGMTFDGKRHRLVVWSGERTVWSYDLDHGKWELAANQASAAAPELDVDHKLILSKWVYLADFDVFAGYNNVNQGVWIYKPGAGGTVAIRQDFAPAQAGKKIVCAVGSTDADCNYGSLCAALHDAKDGDVITLRAGIYREGCAITANRITLLAQPGALLTGVAYGGKANLVLVGNDAVIDGLECSKAYAGGNGACIRIEGRNATLRHMHIHDEQMGILQGGPNGKIVIEDSLIENIGAPNSDLSHCIYIGHADEVDIRRNVIRRSLYEGHLIKSRAFKTIIEDNVLAALDANNSREIDIPQGGETVIRNNVIEKGPASDNWDSIGLALEPQTGIHEKNDTLIENNWFIFDRPQGILLTNHSPGPVRVTHNRFVHMKTGETDDSRKRGQSEAWDDNKFYASRAEAGLGPYPALPPIEK